MLGCLLAAGFAAEPFLALARGGGRGGGTPAWAHWLCSPAALHAAAHAVRGSGVVAAVASLLEVHWPHLLPLAAGLATLLYLRRADARHRALVAVDPFGAGD